MGVSGPSLLAESTDSMMHALSVLPKNSSRHYGRAWFGHGLWLHQSFRPLSFPTSKKCLCRRLAGPICPKYAGENTGTPIVLSSQITKF